MYQFLRELHIKKQVLNKNKREISIIFHLGEELEKNNCICFVSVSINKHIL